MSLLSASRLASSWRESYSMEWLYAINCSRDGSWYSLCFSLRQAAALHFAVFAVERVAFGQHHEKSDGGADFSLLRPLEDVGHCPGRRDNLCRAGEVLAVECQEFFQPCFEHLFGGGGAAVRQRGVARGAVGELVAVLHQHVTAGKESLLPGTELADEGKGRGCDRHGGT